MCTAALSSSLPLIGFNHRFHQSILPALVASEQTMAPIASIECILAIPPIRHRISIHLRQHDLAQAVRVNRAWHRVLLPHLWSLLKGFNLHSFQSPEIRASLVNNGHHIRVLRTNTHEFLTFLGPTCANLVTFDYSGSFPAEAREDRSVGDLVNASSWSPQGIQTQENSPGQTKQGENEGQGLDPLSPQLPCHERALELMGSFVLQNQNLTTLSFRRFVDSRRYLDRLLTHYQILKQLPKLKDLTLTSKSLHSSALAVLLRQGQNLERLCLKIRQIEWQIRYSNQEMAAVLQEPSTAGKTWKLKELQFGPIEGFDVSILVGAAGGSLESLGLERLSLYEAQVLSKVVREQCPNLKHLVIRTDNKIDKNGLSLLLDAAAGAAAPSQSFRKSTKGCDNSNTTFVTPSPPLALPHPKQIRGGLTDFQGHALILPDFLIPRLFAKHYESIEFLDLSRSQGIKSESIQRILCQCPNLRVLDMASEYLTLETKDILCGPRWACERLEILQIEITCSPPPYDDLPPLPPLDANDDDNHSTTTLKDRPWTAIEVQKQVLAQIGTFTRMQELMIGGSHGRSLDLTLREGGLQLLSGLKRMRNMNVKKMGHKAGQQELEWMLQQWPMVRLLMFQGYNPDTVDFDRLAQLKIAGRKGVTATQSRHPGKKVVLNDSDLSQSQLV